MEKKLRECPFCDGEASYDRDKCNNYYGYIDYVECNKCGATIKGRNDAPIIRWNTRVAPENATVAVEERSGVNHERD